MCHPARPDKDTTQQWYRAAPCAMEMLTCFFWV
jgi:hypothetical protein